MNKPINTLAVLIVEDVESDALLVVRLLKKAGYDLVYEQVENVAQMRAALEARIWDIVISDYSLPQFDGHAALKLLQEAGYDIPFIVISGTIGEETAVSMMKAGASDYLVKGNLTRLVPAVERELRQAQVRRERKLANEALQVSTAQLHTLIQVSPLAIIMLNVEGKVILWNSSAERIFGWQAREIVGHPNPIVPMSKREEYGDLVEQIFQGRPVDLETVRQRKDGSLVHVNISSAAIFDDAGHVTGRMAIIADITERKQAEDALAASESELRALFASMQDVVLVIDREGIYRKIAPTNHSLLVRPSEELLGKSLRDVFPVERAGFFIDTIRHVLDTRQVAKIEYELLIGEHIIWFETSISPMDNDCSLWVARDVTARKRTEDALAASEAELRALVEQVPAIVYTESAENRETIYISPQVEKMTGYTPAEWINDRDLWQKIIHPEDRAAVVEMDRLTTETREPFYTEYRILTRDGCILWIHDEAVIINNQDGTPLFWQGVMYDITERKKIEESMQNTNILLEQTLEQSPIPMALVSMPDGIIRSANSACRRFLGIEDEPSPVGTLFSDLKPSWQDLDMQGNPATIEELPLFRSLMGLKTDPQERRIIRKDGTSVYELVYGSPIFDAAGKVIAGYLVMMDITERKQAEEAIRQRVQELEMLYQSGLALSQLLNPKEIGMKILELLEEKLNWRHTRIRLYHPQDDGLELLDFNQPGLNGETERHEMVRRFQTLITHSGQGMTGWVVRHGQPVRNGNVDSDPRYVEAYPGIHSGLYVPMKLGEHVVGVISIEDERPDAFSEADERLIVTLANQAASAFENARLFEETRQRVMELETVNRISLVLRAVSKQNEMLSIVLDEALSILNTSHGSIVLYNKTTDCLERTIARGWTAQLTEEPHAATEGIAGKVFTTGDIHISREFASDPDTRAVSRSQIPPNWGGVCLPIRTSQHTLGVIIVSVPGERNLNRNEIRLLSILSEMTGAALQRMQLHEQTVHRLEQLNALRAVDQAISSSRDMHLTLNILLTHTVSQLKVDAADILLFHPGSNLLEPVASYGFHTRLLESTGLKDSFAGRAILEHRSIMMLDFEAARQNPRFGKLWREEGFVRYWCVPLTVKGEVKGALEVYCREPFTPDTEWIEFLDAFSGQAAIAIDNTQLFENLQRANMDLNLAYDATIEGWSRAMDLRDHETEGHTLRVTDLTINLARAMPVNESQLTVIRRGALLHDIGKIGVPDAILHKEGKLTDEEWAVMRTHPELARDMLMPITYLNDALNIPYCHHEKWDGTGYPQGLKGNQIPLMARIFAVVDVWDALTNDRPYRKKWTEQKARQYIEEQSGQHFDPQVVDVFLKMIEKN
jgi:PAS domain S-box-containing protein